MKIRKWRRKLGGLLVCLLLAALLPTAAFARGRIDTGAPVSLTIQYPCQGISFRLYRVAEVSASGTYTLTGDFEGYPVTLKQPDQAGWRALAATLDGYAARDERKPLTTGETDENGRLTFSGLEAGLYLVTWRKHSTGGYTYTPEPFLVSLPGLDGEDNWVSDVAASPKYDREKDSTGGPVESTVRRKALKVWKDEDDGSGRPESVTVQLLRNGKVYDTVTLSEKNRWSYEWSGLDKEDTWQVVEDDVPEDYTVTVTREGITFVVTNTLSTDIPGEPVLGETTPGTPDQPGTPESGGPGEPETSIPEEPVPQGPALPQTGMLWWPVPLLACGGMALFLIGWARRRSEEQHGA